MTEYQVLLPEVDEHFEGEGFVSEILKLSNGTNEDGRPVFVTNDLLEIMAIVREACEVCRRHFRTIVLRIEIEMFGQL